MALIQLLSTIDPSELTPHSRDVVEHLADESGNQTPMITCLNRSPHKQAVVMHDNLIKHGVQASRDIYKGPGQQVIDVFVECLPLSAATTIIKMEEKIRELGPTTVSHHCSDVRSLQVVDIALSSLTDHDAFVELAQAHGSVLGISKCLDEPGLHCVHLEIPQPTIGQEV